MLPEDYERARRLFADNTEKEKLMVLRVEAKNLLNMINGYAKLMSIIIKEPDSPHIPDDFAQWCEIIVTESHKLNDLLDASVGIEHNDI